MSLVQETCLLTFFLSSDILHRVNTEATEKVRSVMNIHNVYSHRLKRGDGYFIQRVSEQIDSKDPDLCSHVYAD